MAYFLTHTLSFTDTHELHPASWRVEIWDDEAISGITPKTLIPSAEPLVLERIDTSDDKSTSIIGRQAILQYEYTGSVDEPRPELFFNADERRFRLDVYKNNIVYGSFYVKPDSCEYDYKSPPFTVSLTAVDGLSFTKGVKWNAFTSAGALDYRWMSLYEILIERGLSQVMSDNVETNVICTIKPENIAGATSFLNDLYVHSDLFIDFTAGPDSVYAVMEKIARQFYLRIFIAQNMIWVVRAPDLAQNSITVENYINGVYAPIVLQTINRTVGVSRSGNDATPVDDFARVIMFSALKEAKFSVDYRSINQLKNFQWGLFDGADFDFWEREGKAEGNAITVGRLGSGSDTDPYRLFIPYPQTTTFPYSIFQYTPDNSVSQGSIVTISFKYQWGNVKSFRMIISAGLLGPGAPGGEYWTLDADGSWKYTDGIEPGYITITRDGNKDFGTFSLTSKAIPYLINRPFPDGRVKIEILAPQDPESLDPTTPTGIQIYPIKLSISPLSSLGRKITDVNNGRYSKKSELDKFYFIDTGVNTISNTISVNNSGTPAKNWAAVGAPTDKQDIERHMADSQIDQYARPVYGWEGNLYSNAIEFWNIYSLDYLSGRKFIQTTDRYIVRTCTHVTNMQEILPENGADTTYSEFDIEDSNE